MKVLRHPCDTNFPNYSELRSSVNASMNKRKPPEEDEEVDPLSEYRSPASETCLQSIIPD